MGQVWSKANFDGMDNSTHLGGRGSVLAVTAQNPGPDGKWETDDDLLAPLNVAPVSVSLDANPGPDCFDLEDRVRGFYSFHNGGAHFAFADSSVRFVVEGIVPRTYRALSTIGGSESLDGE